MMSFLCTFHIITKLDTMGVQIVTRTAISGGIKLIAPSEIQMHCARGRQRGAVRESGGAAQGVSILEEQAQNTRCNPHRPQLPAWLGNAFLSTTLSPLRPPRHAYLSTSRIKTKSSSPLPQPQTPSVCERKAKKRRERAGGGIVRPPTLGSGLEQV